MSSPELPPPAIRLVESAATSLRLAEARAFVSARARHEGVQLVGASRGSVDDLARFAARESGAAIGLHRFSLTQLAARLAAPELADAGRAPVTYLGSEAAAARATFEAHRAGTLAYFAPVAFTPGFPRALARTLQELRMALVPPGALASLPLGGADLAALLDRFEQEFASASATDRAALFQAATVVLRRHAIPHRGRARAPKGTPRPRKVSDGPVGLPLLLLDVPLESTIEFDFVRALIDTSPDVLITVPFGDVPALQRYASLGIEPEVLAPPPAGTGGTDLDALRRYLFARSQPPMREPTGEVRLFSAPGEGRESVEIARRILEEAAAGVPFDEMAVFVRTPQQYAGLLDHAFTRAGIPAWFERGTVRPHPAGRAFVAILDCAREKLSARRFAEYLSLAQVPSGLASAADIVTVPDDEMLGLMGERAPRAQTSVDEETAGPVHGEAASDDEAVVEGALRAPWKWERLIVESAVIGGDAERWHRRLDGLAEEFRVRIQEEGREDPESPRVRRLERDLRNLAHLKRFALPLVDALAAWPAQATWGDWLDRFAGLAPLVLKRPDRVLHVLAELRPMREIGPVPLEEARDVLAERLLMLEIEPPAQRYGRVFVGSARQARGRAFRVVFVAGLAERLFPRKPHEDPMLLDEEMRIPLGAALAIQEDRGREERLLLRLAAGAATGRLWLSYPRIEISESRPRVPSFYALDVMRAVTGRVPDHEALQARAAAEGGAGLAWPSPSDAARAIDDMEHDLAVIRELLLTDTAPAVRGHAHYLLQLNDCLRRSVTARWSRARSAWTPFDGLTRVPETAAPALASQRLGARPYSLSALQKFATCPYQFFLSAVHRLQPAEEPEPLQKLDPLTRGALFHEAQAEFFRELQREARLPVRASDLPHALAVLHRVMGEVASRYHEALAPAIERVWQDEIADVARDLRVWVRRLPESPDWRPEYFEFSFGLSDAGRDPRSVPDPVRVDGRFLLRGSVDLIERHTASELLRVTDHKTGKSRTTPRTVVGGGAALQPVLYGLVVEQALGAPVQSGRLFYCTAAGGFTDHEIPLQPPARRAGLEVLEIVDRALELGFLPAAPAPRACVWCDFRPVCGPDEERRVGMKSQDRLSDLAALRGMA